MIDEFHDQNDLEEWPLSQLILKCHKLEELFISGFYYTTAANKS